MRNYEQIYIDGAWVASDGQGVIDVINAGTEQVMGSIHGVTPPGEGVSGGKSANKNS